MLDIDLQLSASSAAVGDLVRVTGRVRNAADRPVRLNARLALRGPGPAAAWAGAFTLDGGTTWERSHQILIGPDHPPGLYQATINVNGEERSQTLVIRR